MRALFATLGAGVLLAFGVRPGAHQRVRPAWHFWVFAVLAGLITCLQHWILIEAPRKFFPGGLYGDALITLAVLGAVALWCQATRQPVRVWTLASLVMAASLPMAIAQILIYLLLATDNGLSPDAFQWLHAAFIAWWIVMIGSCVSFVLDRSSVGGQLLGALLIAAATLAPSELLDAPRYWYPDWEQMRQKLEEESAAEPTETLAPVPDAESLFFEQPAQVAKTLAGLEAQRPGQVDLYLVAFGGFAEEDVFRNEVFYAQRLFTERFSIGARSVVLLNHRDTLDTHPLATLRNLREVLQGVGRVMDRDEDILLLFLTSHGSPEHELAVQLGELPFARFDPQSLRETLDASEIRWRALLVSACYSGGYVDALRSPTTLVMTAARADRTSFGCGVDSDITYFGRAYLAEALNETTSLRSAFEIARNRVAEREKEEDQTPPSEPQIDEGALIPPKLRAWERTLEPTPPVPFDVE